MQRNRDRGDSLETVVARAIERRKPLARDDSTTVYRLLNGTADGVPGATADRYGAVVVVNLYDADGVARETSAAGRAGAAGEAGVAGETGVRRGAGGAVPEQALVRALATLPDVRGVYVKRRPRTAARLSDEQTAALAPSRPAWGARSDELAVRENGLHYLIRPGAGLSTGLFPDMREARARVRALSAGRAVLNLFAYTCAFGVAALSGGAARALNIDAARPALQWGQDNYTLNGLDADPYDLVYGDVFDWLGRLARREARFDLVIADPPSYSTVKGRRFAASRDYAALAEACARVVAPGGLLLCCSNEARQSRRAFQVACLQGVATAGRAARVRSYDGAPDIDFPRLPGDEGHLKVLSLELTVGLAARRSAPDRMR